MALRSAPASPTHGLQFHAPPAPVTHVPRENSPTKTVTQAADAAGSQAKATPTSPPIIPASGLPPPVPSLPSTVLKQSAALQAIDRKSTRLNSSHVRTSRMPSSA